MIRETDTQTTENRLREAYDVIVIGAGAAGMMAAGTAARSGKRVLLLEKMEKSGRKVRISGKGRCNLTNARPPEEFLTHVRTNADFFEVAFAEFNNKATIRFFERMGVKLEIERGERVFPKSGKAWDVANALLEYCVENGVKIEYNCRVQEILTAAGKVYGVKYMNKRGFSRKEEAPAVILCTGGVSYPGTGSTGDGYLFAADLGHTIEPVRPSLTPLKSSHTQMKFMDKLLLRNVRVKLFVEGEEVREEFGEIGFSERGIEGAVALRVSRDAVDALIDEKRVKLVVDLKPGLTEEMLLDRIERDLAEMQPDEFFSELLRKLVPKALVLPIANELDIHSKNYVRKLSEAEKLRLVKLLKGFVFPITDYAPFPFAVVTAGGVRCDEVNKYTMESLKVKGLYFAGEVLDLDANTGGYNLQIAFSTGRLAGMLKK
jgi:predicted Rossmann fold flavoprotein